MTDSVFDLLFCLMATSVENLRREGIRSGVTGCEEQRVTRPTIHRVNNMDYKKNLRDIMVLSQSSERVVLRVHPLTQQATKGHGITPFGPNISLIKSLGYRDLSKLVSQAHIKGSRNILAPSICLKMTESIQKGRS